MGVSVLGEPSGRVRKNLNFPKMLRHPPTPSFLFAPVKTELKIFSRQGYVRGIRRGIPLHVCRFSLRAHNYPRTLCRVQEGGSLTVKEDITKDRTRCSAASCLL